MLNLCLQSISTIDRSLDIDISFFNIPQTNLLKLQRINIIRKKYIK